MIKSSKFWISAIGLLCITGIQAYAMYLSVTVPTEFIGVIAAVVGTFGGLKTYQNVALSNGNGNGESK